MVFSIYKAVYVHQTPVGVDKSWNNLENNKHDINLHYSMLSIKSAIHTMKV